MGKIDIEGGQLKSTDSVRHQLMLDARHLPDNPWNTEVTPTVSVTTFLHDAAVERPTTTNGGKKKHDTSDAAGGWWWILFGGGVQ